MSILSKILKVVPLTVIAFSLLSTTVSAERILVRDYDYNDNYYYNSYRQPVRRYQDTNYSRNYDYPRNNYNNNNVNVNVDIDLSMPAGYSYQRPSYYPLYAYDYFLIDYPQDDFYLYNYYPKSMKYWWY